MRQVAVLLLGALCFLLVGLVMEACTDQAAADPAPALSSQPRTDQFPGLDQYNGLSAKVRETGEVRWAYQVVSGCSGGVAIFNSIQRAMQNITEETNASFVYVNDLVRADLVLRTNCGTSFAAVCGTGAIACLGRNFPYVQDIDFLQDLAGFFDVSQQSIVLHELMGHAMATWNEQYCAGYNSPVVDCAGWGAAVPGWHDFMNTGPESRHLIEAIERQRWGRTMGAPAPDRYGRGEDFIWFCGSLPKATGVALFGWSEWDYRFIGAVMLRELPSQPDGCRGLWTDGYVEAWECPAIDVGNAVDWLKVDYRSDRVLC